MREVAVKHAAVSFAFVALATLGLAAAARAPAAALEPTVEQFTLENGLRVFVRPIPGAKGAFAQLLYTIGEQDDPPGQSGLAQIVAEVHASARAGDVLLALNHAIGPYGDGRHEIAVHDDYTAFCEGGPADSFRAVLEELSLRMRDLRITVEDVERAREALARGPRPRLFFHSDDSTAIRTARAAARDRLLPLPGGGRRGGVPAEIGKISVDVVRERWRRFYKPSNAILAVAGDVDPALVRRGVRRQFGTIPAGERPDPRPALRGTPRSEAVSVPFQPHVHDLLLPGRSARAACVSIVAPPPSDAHRMAAALVLAARFRSAPAAADPDESRLFALLVGETAPRAIYRPLVDAGTIDLVWNEDGMPEAEASLARLREGLSAATDRPASDSDARRIREDSRLGLRLVPDESDAQDPAEVALGIARRAQLGIDGQRVLDEVPKVTIEDLRGVVGAPSASAVAHDAIASLLSPQLRWRRKLRELEQRTPPQPGEVREVEGRFAVMLRGATVQAQPDVSAPLVWKAPTGSRVKVLEVREAWVRVESVAAPRLTGWLRASDLR